MYVKHYQCIRGFYINNDSDSIITTDSSNESISKNYQLTILVAGKVVKKWKQSRC